MLKYNVEDVGVDDIVKLTISDVEQSFVQDLVFVDRYHCDWFMLVYDAYVYNGSDFRDAVLMTLSYFTDNDNLVIDY